MCEQWGTRGAARPAPRRWTRFSSMVCLRVRLHRCGAHEALDWAHVNRLSSELCVDWATLLSVSAMLN